MVNFVRNYSGFRVLQQMVLPKWNLAETAGEASLSNESKIRTGIGL
jgi:hypothetical protein